MTASSIYDGIVRTLGSRKQANRLVFVSERFNYVYVANQKAACSTIKLMLYRAHTGNWSFNPENIRVARVLPASKAFGYSRQNAAQASVR